MVQEVTEKKTGPLSNRACMVYKPRHKKLRDVPETEPEKGYFKFLWQGYDSLQECFNVKLKPDFVKMLETKKEEAILVGHPITIPFKMGKVEYQICESAPRGFRFLIQSDDLIFLIANPEKEWSVSVRYLSAGLCEWGADVLRSEVQRMLGFISTPFSDDYVRLSRVDVATDFYSEKFAFRLRPSILDGLVVPSRCKVRQDELLSFYLTQGRFDTLTIGSKNSLQLQIYDKAKEIHQHSGKTYFFKLWGMSAKKNVFRFEIRFFSEFLRNRGIRTFESFEKFRNELISEALNIRRLTVPSLTDNNRSRWPYHPLYTFVRRSFLCGPFGLAIGRYVTGKRSVLQEQGLKRIAGDMRSLSVLRNHGLYKERDIYVIFQLVMREIDLDKRHQEKIERARERYKYVDCAA